MLEALIPYIVAPEKTLVQDLPLIGELKLQLFGPLVATGVIVGWYRGLAYAKKKDIDEFLFRDYMFWMLVSAFVISHWVSVIFYFPERVQENPWILLQIWNGLSSVGGFFGATVGAFLYLRWYCGKQPIGKQPIIVFGDATLFGLLGGWCFGRAGCSLVHDHPGRVVPEGTFLAVGPWPDGSWRYDLGLVEFMFVVTLMSVVYFIVKWDKWRQGRMVGLIAFTYAPFRFYLDSLRADEPATRVIQDPDLRYAGLTTAQWFTIAFFLVGAYLLFFRKPKATDFDYAKDSERREREAAEEAEGSGDDEPDSNDDSHDDDDERSHDSEDGDGDDEDDEKKSG